MLWVSHCGPGRPDAEQLCYYEAEAQHTARARLLSGIGSVTATQSRGACTDAAPPHRANCATDGKDKQGISALPGQRSGAELYNPACCREPSGADGNSSSNGRGSGQ